MKDRIFWDNKHPQVQQMYKGRPLPGASDRTYLLDVRHFVWPDDVTLLKIISENYLRCGNAIDETVWRVQKWVVANLKYVSDETLGCPEYWLFPGETVELMHDDCEGGACLIASLCLNALPVEEHWRIRVNAGWVQEAPTAPEGGHGYVTYFRETDGESVPVDWCFFEDSLVPVENKQPLKENTRYKDIWFSFSYYAAWSHVNYVAKGRLKRNRLVRH